MRVLRPPTEEEADDQEAGGQHERPKARAAPSDKGRVGFVQGIPHLGAAGGASWDLGLCCGPPAAGQRDSGTAGQRLPPTYAALISYCGLEGGAPGAGLVSPP